MELTGDPRMDRMLHQAYMELGRPLDLLRIDDRQLYLQIIERDWRLHPEEWHDDNGQMRPFVGSGCHLPILTEEKLDKDARQG